MSRARGAALECRHPVAAAIVAGAANRHLLFLSDFDGTLCEFSPDPAAVWLSERRRALLAALATRRHITVGLITGRRLADIRARAGLIPAAFLAGLHGLEIEGQGTHFVHPRAGECRGLMRRLREVLIDGVRALDGVELEDKDLSLVVHVRAAPRASRVAAEQLVNALAGSYLADRQIRVQPGDGVLELLPNILWNKGHAVGWIRQEAAARATRAIWPVYVGDDMTDVDAFDALPDGLRVAVGRRIRDADLRVPDPAAVEGVLDQLAHTTVGL